MLTASNDTILLICNTTHFVYYCLAANGGNLFPLITGISTITCCKWENVSEFQVLVNLGAAIKKTLLFNDAIYKKTFFKLSNVNISNR